MTSRKEAICEWLSLESEESLKQQLQAAVAEDSRMQDICFKKKMHEELYKKPNLRNGCKLIKPSDFQIIILEAVSSQDLELGMIG